VQSQEPVKGSESQELRAERIREFYADEQLSLEPWFDGGSPSVESFVVDILLDLGYNLT